MHRNITHQMLLLPLLQPQHLPERPRLHEVYVRDFLQIIRRRAEPLLVPLRRLHSSVRIGPEWRRVIRRCAVVPRDSAGAVALEGRVGVQGAVDGDLLVVDAETVALGVGVAEEAGLEHGVDGGFDAGDEVGGGEGELFDVGEVV